MFPTYSLVDSPLVLPDNTIFSTTPPDYEPPNTRQPSPPVAPALPSDAKVPPLKPAPGPSGAIHGHPWLSSDEDSSEAIKSSDSSEGTEDGELPSIAALLKSTVKPKLYEMQFQDRPNHLPLIDSAWKQTARLYTRVRGGDSGKRHKLRLAVLKGEAELMTVERPVLYLAKPIARILGTAIMLTDVITCRGLEPLVGERRSSMAGRPLLMTLKDNTFCVLPSDRKKLDLPQLSWIQVDHILSTTLGPILFKETHLMLLSLDDVIYDPIEEATLHKMASLMHRVKVPRPPTFKQKVRNFFRRISNFLRPY